MNKKSKTALSANETNSFLRRILIVFPYLWLVLFFLIPFLYVFKISFSTPILAQPPYSQIFDFIQNFTNWLKVTWDNYLFILEDNLYWISYLKSIKVYQNLHGFENPYLSNPNMNLGMIYLKEGSYEKAIEYFSKALEISSKFYGDDISYRRNL